MLTGKQKGYLRSLASLLNSVIIVGKKVIAGIGNGLKINKFVKIEVSKIS